MYTIVEYFPWHWLVLDEECLLCIETATLEGAIAWVTATLERSA